MIFILRMLVMKTMHEVVKFLNKFGFRYKMEDISVEEILKECPGKQTTKIQRQTYCPGINIIILTIDEKQGRNN